MYKRLVILFLIGIIASLTFGCNVNKEEYAEIEIKEEVPVEIIAVGDKIISNEISAKKDIDEKVESIKNNDSNELVENSKNEIKENKHVINSSIIQENEENENLEENANDEEEKLENNINITEENKVMYASVDLNIRKGPGADFEKLGYYKTNDEVKVTGICENRWARVDYNNQEAYVNGKYLSNEKVEIIEVINNTDMTGFVFDGNVSQECRNKAIELYSKVPQNVKNAIVNAGYQVVVSANSAWTDGHAGTYYPTGWTGWQGKSICIYAGSVNKVNIAVIHEIGHFIDEYIGIKSGCGLTEFGYRGVTETNEWKEIYAAEVGLSGFPGYATDCKEDYFAEVVWKSLASPEWCKKTIPRSYEFAMRQVNAC